VKHHDTQQLKYIYYKKISNKKLESLSHFSLALLIMYKDKHPYPLRGSNDVESEYLRPKQMAKLFNISRSKVYELINKGILRSVSLRDEGQTKATRLISVKSFRNYLEMNSTGGINNE